jgi:hypothetical protein
MASRTLAATAAAAFQLAAIAAFADSHPPPPTPTRVWLAAGPIRVVQTVNDDGTRRCTLDVVNGPAHFGITTTGPTLRIWLGDRSAPKPLNRGYIRIQFDNAQPWWVDGDADPATPSIFVSSPVSLADGLRFIPQLARGRSVRVEMAGHTFLFSLAGMLAGLQATTACEAAITGRAPIRRDL